MIVSRFGRSVVDMDLIVLLLVVVIVSVLVGSVVVSPLLWALVVILVLFSAAGSRPLLRTARVMARSRAAEDRSDGSGRLPVLGYDHLQLWLGPSSLGRRGSAVTHRTQQGGHVMGSKTDKTIGRAKQAAGAVTGDQETKREGERQENKGKLKGKLDSTFEKAQHALEDLKHKVDRK